MFDDMLHQGELYVTNVSNVNNGACTDPDGKMLRTIGNHALYNGAYEWTDGTAIYGNEKINNGGAPFICGDKYLFFNPALSEIWYIDSLTLQPKRFCKSPWIYRFWVGENGCYCRNDDGLFDLVKGTKLDVPYEFGGEPVDSCVDENGDLIFAFYGRDHDAGGNYIPCIQLVKNGSESIALIPANRDNSNNVRLYDDHSCAYFSSEGNSENTLVSKSQTHIKIPDTPPAKLDPDTGEHKSGYYVYIVDLMTNGGVSSTSSSFYKRLDTLDDVRNFKGGIFNVDNHYWIQEGIKTDYEIKDYFVDRYGNRQIVEDRKYTKTSYHSYSQALDDSGEELHSYLYNSESSSYDDLFGTFDSKVSQIESWDKDLASKDYKDSDGRYHSYRYVVVIRDVDCPYRDYTVPPNSQNNHGTLLSQNLYDAYRENGSYKDGKPIYINVKDGSIFGKQFSRFEVGDFVEVKKGKILCLTENGYIYNIASGTWTDIFAKSGYRVAFNGGLNFRIRKIKKSLLPIVKKNIESLAMASKGES